MNSGVELIDKEKLISIISKLLCKFLLISIISKPLFKFLLIQHSGGRLGKTHLQSAYIELFYPTRSVLDILQAFDKIATKAKPVVAGPVNLNRNLARTFIDKASMYRF